ERPGREHGVQEVGQRGRVLELELGRAARHAEPCRLAREPHAHLDACRDGGRRDGERLVRGLGPVEPGRRLDDERAGAGGHAGVHDVGHAPSVAPPDGRPGATACALRPAGRIGGMSPHTLELIFLVLLIAATVTITWFAGYVVYKLYKGQR